MHACMHTHIIYVERKRLPPASTGAYLRPYETRALKEAVCAYKRGQPAPASLLLYCFTALLLLDDRAVALWFSSTYLRPYETHAYQGALTAVSRLYEGSME